jgi:L-threonylcarbamoyladenylate synthase
MPKHRRLLRLIKLTGPLYSTSANISGNKPIKKTIDAYDEFKNHLSKIVVIKGKQNNVYPSTIVNFDDFTILRRGNVDGQLIVKKLQESVE